MRTPAASHVLRLHGDGYLRDSPDGLMVTHEPMPFMERGDHPVYLCTAPETRLIVRSSSPVPTRPHPDCGVHHMMVIGEETIFLAHLPMFQSEHRFQVIMEASVREQAAGY
jgi:hypothetical protein